jgi:hypothetical protein
MDKLPFELCKYHKSRKIWEWEKKYGIIFDGLSNKIYDVYIHASNCDRCGKKFKDSKDRQLDHDHLITDKFNVRGILCISCNVKNRQVILTSTGEQYISKINSKAYKQGFYYRLRIVRDKVNICNKRNNTLEKAIECRDKFIAENPTLFT